MSTEQQTPVTKGFSSFQDFLVWEYTSNDTIDLKRIYCDLAGGLKPGLLLSQILYWHLPSKKGGRKLTINKLGRLWLAKADQDWYPEIRLNKQEALASRRILEELGLITCMIWKFAGKNCVHIAVNEQEFLNQLTAMINISEEIRDAGPINKARRVGPKKPGSKPGAGYRRKKVGGETAGETSAEPSGEMDQEMSDEGNQETPDETRSSIQEIRNDNSRIIKTIIQELSERQSSDYRNDNSGIIETIISYTESTPETPAEIPAETPAEKNIIIVTDSEVTSELADDDDDLPEFGNETALIAEGSSTVVTDNGVTPLTGSVEAQPTGGQTVNATDTEKVPPAAAAPVETVDNWAVLALPAVDLDVLLVREARDPVSNATLRRAMSCSDVSRIDHMNDQLSIPLGTTSSNRLVTRDLYTRLTDEEIEAAIVAARVDAKKGVQQFAALGYHALDAMVGFPPSIEVLTKTRKRSASGPSAGAPVTALGAAYEVKGAGARAGTPTPAPEPGHEAPRPEYQPGAVWQHQGTKAEVTVAKHEGLDVHVLGSTGIQVIRILDLTRHYRPLPS
ncbi:hypothetical protein [Deinococcus sp. ME38]|uniref:hypothetical protein n=1 Tax=Deinococcus sp. ME38 TaxID=3400344 RepID=UPI003B5A0A12